MDVFKTKPGLNESIIISEENFTKATDKKIPYYMSGGAQKPPRCFAVCPICDNPIQIIGLYKRHDEGRNPYGRHFPKDIGGLAAYDEEAYYGCYYANPNQRRQVGRRNPRNVTGIALYNLLREQFDRLIYILETSIEIKISYAFAEEILRRYLLDEGWQYYDSTYNNLPFMLIYAMQAKPLINRLVLKDGSLYRFLKEDCTAVYLEDLPDSKYAKITAKEGFVGLSFYLCNHNVRKQEESIEETYRLVVVEKESIIYERLIQVDPDFLRKLIALPQEKSRRNPKMLKIAENLMVD